ncbi:GNAT family N-acetyltransferase [Arthrobacter sp. TWP1-1]|uniref:GNAT family N-acetyltransferase n=1 Tax=Arthrobacter sp. TWP1-1 TaxID=2804568 RepID=UPI003CF920C4
MTIPLRLIAISPESFPAWRERSRSEYESDLVATGESAQSARQRAEASLAEAFPQDVPTPDNAVFDVADESGTIVGYLWVGTDTSGDSQSWWVWDIVINPDQRGKGLGRATMLKAEEYARSQGAVTLGLSVFGFNKAARGLYDSLGYETVTVKMRKKL